MSIFKKKPQQSQSFYFYVAGMQYYIDNLHSIGNQRPKYKLPDAQLVLKATGKKAYKYGYPSEPLRLIPEPQNPHDKNAIQVLLNNVLIGYVPANQCAMVHQIISRKKITALSIFIDGGEYKEINGNKVIPHDDPVSGQVRVIYYD